MVTLKDISLKNYSLDNLKLISRLREKHFNTQTEVCVERALLMTRYLVQQNGSGDNGKLNRA